MRVMVLVKATEDSEKGVVMTPQFKKMIEEMNKYNEELKKAGVMIVADGLTESAKGARVGFNGSDRKVVTGPFANPRELVAGFWLWNVKDMDDAIAWVKRCPNPMPGYSEIEIRPIQDEADFK